VTAKLGGLNMEKVIKVGDIVTVDLGDINNASNTYVVAYVVGDKAILKHPLDDRLLIAESINYLDNVGATLQNPMEKCLFFAKANAEVLDHNTVAELEAHCLYFVKHKKFAKKQMSIISNICGKIAAIKLYDMATLVNYVTENKGVLDQYNMSNYNRHEKFFKDIMLIQSKHQRITMYNIAGFTMAQLFSGRK